MVYDILDGWRAFRCGLSGQDRRHRIGNAHILAAMANASTPTLVETEDGPQLHFLGADDRGVELHVIYTEPEGDA